MIRDSMIRPESFREPISHAVVSDLLKVVLDYAHPRVLRLAEG